MNILLISVQSNMEVIGLKCLHAALLGKGHDSSLLFLPRLDAAGDQGYAAVGAFVREQQPALIGISLMSTEFFTAAGLSGYLKAACPDIPLVWGGIHPTIAPEPCLDHADYVCVGEGEGTILDMARAAAAGREPACGQQPLLPRGGPGRGARTSGAQPRAQRAVYARTRR